MGNLQAQEMVAKARTCDYGHETTGKVRRLDTGGGSGVFLCREHWNKEMVWRGQRNRSLSKEARFSIRRFPV